MRYHYDPNILSCNEPIVILIPCISLSLNSILKSKKLFLVFEKYSYSEHFAIYSILLEKMLPSQIVLIKIPLNIKTP